MQDRRSSGALSTYTQPKKRDAWIASCITAENAHGIQDVVLEAPSDDKNRHEAKILAEVTSSHLLILLNVALSYTRQSFADTVDL